MFPVSILIIGGRLYRRVEKIRKILKFFDNRCSSLRYPLLYRNVGYETDGYVTGGYVTYITRNKFEESLIILVLEFS